MLRTARLLSLLAVGFLASPTLAEVSPGDPQALPCNALCRRWMGLGEATGPETPPVEGERQAAPAPVVAAPLPSPASLVPRRPEPPEGLRQNPALAAVSRPPAKPPREARTVEVRRAPLPAAAPRVPRASEAAPPRRPALPFAAAIGTTARPVVVPSRAGSAARLAGPSPTTEVATAQPVAVAVHALEPARAATAIDFVLPLLEQPPPPVIVVPTPARQDAFPPAFDVIATLLLTAPPRR